MNMVTVATFNEPSKAEPLKQKLEKAGIHAEICDESRYEWVWFVTKPIAGIRLKVHKRDFEKARQRIREWDAGEGILRDAVRCPQGSSEVSGLKFSRRKRLRTLRGGKLMKLLLAASTIYLRDATFRLWH